MPTPAELKAELETGPLAAEIADAWANGRTGEVADALNRKDRSGYVPARWVSVSLARFPTLDALVHWCMTNATLPAEFGGGACPFAMYALFRNLDRLDQSVGKGDLRADTPDISAALAQAAAANLVADAQNPNRPIPAGFGSYLLSGEVKISRAEELWGYGVGVSLETISEARKLG